LTDSIFTKTNKFFEKQYYMGIGERLNLQEIETASSRFKICPKCNSRGGFWLGLKRDHAYVQCKSCGAKFELFEVYEIGEKDKAPERFKFFRK
jgi:DNA-directed RNA polymerase subunit M/transcription elongation factor TFIIS